MKRWVVTVYELHTMEWLVEADDIHEAVEKVYDGDGVTSVAEELGLADEYGYNGILSVITPGGDTILANELKKCLNKTEKSKCEKHV